MKGFCAKIKKIICVMTGTAIMLSLFGCAKEQTKDDSFLRMNEVNFTIGEVTYLMSAFLYACDQKYTNLYGNDYLDLQIFSDSDLTIAEYEKEYRFYDELTSLLGLYDMALAEKVEPNDYDESKLTKKAEEQYALYVAAQSKMDASTATALYNQTTVSDIYHVLVKYAYAAAMKDYLVKNLAIEVSDEESRVVNCFFAVFDQDETAKQFYQSIHEKEEDMFIQTANDMGADVKSIDITHQSEFPESVLQAVFDCKDTEITKVIQNKDTYLVIYVKDSFNEDLSHENWEKLTAERIYEGWHTACLTYQKNSACQLQDETWKKLNFKEVLKVQFEDELPWSSWFDK